MDGDPNNMGREPMLVRAILTIATVLCSAGGLMQPAAPIVIAHRGASGYLPEHTLEAYRLAIEMGADVIEPDLVSTKDGVLIARHEHEIGGTTDVAEKFPGRRTTKRVESKPVTGWFSEDFTLHEIRTLRAKERLPFRSHDADGKFAIPTFEDVLALVRERANATGRTLGIYPETKHPGYFRRIGLPLEEAVARQLDAYGLRGKTDLAFIQSFDPESLRRLRTMTHVRLVQLTESVADVQPVRLDAIATYADGIGVEKRLVLPVSADGQVGPATSVVTDAHARGLFVHVWTMRREPNFLPVTYAGDMGAEARAFAALGVDGLFTDFPDLALAALRRQPAR
jgi:glycerophosphoryl diester phosphodiesterase